MRIVLVRLSALGDIVHTWPLACALAETEPRPHLSWVVEESLKPLIDGHPAVDAVFTVRTGRWRKRPFSIVTRSEVAAFRTRLRELDPDLAIDPQGTAKSAMVVRWTRAARKVGLARPWRRELFARLAYDETLPGAPGAAHIVATNLAMVRAVPTELPDLVAPDGSWLLDRCAGRAPSGPWAAKHAVLLPGTGGAHKVLATTTLAEVARGLKARGFEVIVAWGPGEKERAADVVEASGEGVWLAPPTDLEELAALLGGAALVIGGDTGPVHLAASFGTPTLAIFVASDWRRNGPLGARTAVVSGADEGRAAPSGTARTRRRREVGAAEILKSALELVEH